MPDAYASGFFFVIFYLRFLKMKDLVVSIKVSGIVLNKELSCRKWYYSDIMREEGTSKQDVIDIR